MLSTKIGNVARSFFSRAKRACLSWPQWPRDLVRLQNERVSAVISDAEGKIEYCDANVFLIYDWSSCKFVSAL